MGRRYQFKDKILWMKVSDVAASNTDDDTEEFQSFDSENALGYGALVDVHSLGSNKKVSLALQHSADNSNFSTVPKSLTNADIDFEISSTGVFNLGYWGYEQYFRVVLISRSASPASTVRVYYWRMLLHSNPDNFAFI